MEEKKARENVWFVWSKPSFTRKMCEVTPVLEDKRTEEGEMEKRAVFWEARNRNCVTVQMPTNTTKKY